jgi:hypothetical protein
MRKLLSGALALSLLAGLSACTSQGYTMDETALAEVKETAQDLFDSAASSDYDGVLTLIDTDLQESFAPVTLYNSLVEQYPDSEACESGSKTLAQYVLSRMYTDAEIERVDVNEEATEGRVVVTWSGIDTSTVDTSTLKDTIDEILDDTYTANQEDYDTNTYYYGQESTDTLIQEDAFPDIFEQVKTLYANATDEEYKGIFCFKKNEDSNWVLTGIVEYSDYLYEDDYYNWEFEAAQIEYENGKENVVESDTSSDTNSDSDSATAEDTPEDSTEAVGD